MNIVVISGGSSGIGKACVAKFLHKKDVVYNLDVKDCKDFLAHPQYHYLHTNVKEHHSIQRSVAQIVTAFQRIDILITSAGKHLSATVENTSDEQLNELFMLNVFGAFWLIQEVLPIMKKNNGGKIITMGSDQSSIAKRNSCAYGMTKAAILSLTKSTALDYARENISINCIGAGTIDTPLYQQAIQEYAQKSGRALNIIEQEEAEMQPIGRIGQPEEIAELAYFLASSKCHFMTGALLPVDGGYIAQ